MTNNPYTSEYHDYLESLKDKLDQASLSQQSQPQSQSQSVPPYIKLQPNPYTDIVYINKKAKKPLIQYAASIALIIIAGVSIISFATQGVLIAFEKYNTKQNTIYVGTEKTVDDIKNLYVRADLEKEVFENMVTDVVTETANATNTGKNTAAEIQKYFNINIPGVTKIGFDNTVTDEFLTENLNKYSATTLVLGGPRQDVNTETVGSDDEVEADNYDIAEKAILPILRSKAYAIADLDTGEIVYEKEADTIYPIASISKLMTALVATEKMDLQDVAIVSKDATNAYGGQGGLKLGEKIRLSELMYPLLMESSNDAAEVFADHYGHQLFMDEMNKKAAELNMVDTYYNDPSGLDPQNSSTPKDLIKLVRYIWKKDASIFSITRVKQFSIKGHTWLNRNPQLPLVGYVGGKNGYIDQALQTTASIFEIPVAKGGTRKLVIVVLKSNDKNGDVLKLINFVKRSVIYTPPVEVK